MLAGPGAGLALQEESGRLLRSAVAAAAGRAGGVAASGGARGRKSRASEPQPELQAWLQKQGLSPAEADAHARRLAHIFGGDQQAALASLPATFAWCRGKGLSGLETAQLLDRIAAQQPGNVARFAETAQKDWQLVEPCIEAHVQRLAQVGKRAPKHASFTDLLRSNVKAARMLALPPGHAKAWLAAVGVALPDPAVVGGLLLSDPLLLTSRPDTPAAVLRWSSKALHVPPAELAAFVAKAPALLLRDPQSLQDHLAALQTAVGAEQAGALAVYWPRLLGTGTSTAQGALAWLQQQLGGDAQRLAAVLGRSPHLLTVSVDGLQRRADFLRQQLGWRPGDGQLAAWIEAHPRTMAGVDFDSADKQALLRLYTGVLGLPLTDCLERLSTYLGYGLETAAARYMLVQVRSGGWLVWRQRLLCMPCTRTSHAPARCPPGRLATLPCSAAGLCCAGTRALAAVRWQDRRCPAVLGEPRPQAAGILRRRHQGGSAGIRALVAPERAGPAPAGGRQVREWMLGG